MKGKKTGGRKKGSKNKSTIAREALAKHAAAGGQEPLDYVLSIMRDKKQKRARRDWAANAALPFVHPRKQSVQVDRTGPPNVTVEKSGWPLPKPTDRLPHQNGVKPLALVHKSATTVDN